MRFDRGLFFYCLFILSVTILFTYSIYKTTAEVAKERARHGCLDGGE